MGQEDLTIKILSVFSNHLVGFAYQTLLYSQAKQQVVVFTTFCCADRHTPDLQGVYTAHGMQNFEILCCNWLVIEHQITF